MVDKHPDKQPMVEALQTRIVIETMEIGDGVPLGPAERSEIEHELFYRLTRKAKDSNKYVSGIPQFIWHEARVDRPEPTRCSVMAVVSDWALKVPWR